VALLAGAAAAAGRNNCDDKQHTNIQQALNPAHQVLKHEEQLVVLADDLLELDHVGVVELAQALHLAQVHALLPGVELALHLLDGHLGGGGHGRVKGEVRGQGNG
jgi:UDP-N-acetyl-D-mannosaminuronic acid transferase (WecB/TagA/CpsF family)